MSLAESFFYFIRDIRAKPLFDLLRTHCTNRARVLDVGGGSFYKSVLARQIQFGSWISIDPSFNSVEQVPHPGVQLLRGDGACLDYGADCFDVVLSIQVLEHVFDPIAMVDEMLRVLRPGGVLIVLVPQTSNLHLLPHHYYNFTPYWVREVFRRRNQSLLSLQLLGGSWSTIASRLFYIVVQSFRFSTTSDRQLHRRSPIFWFVLPVMLVVVIAFMPIVLILSLFDLKEEPNNILAVVRKVVSDEH